MGVAVKDSAGFLAGSVVKSLPANAGRSLDQEEALEKEWQPAPAFLPGESHGQRSLAGYTVHGVTKSWT